MDGNGKAKGGFDARVIASEFGKLGGTVMNNEREVPHYVRDDNDS